MKSISIFILLLVLLGFVYLSYNYDGAEPFHGSHGSGGSGGSGYHGSGRWGSGRWGGGGGWGGSGYGGGWIGSVMYPVSINCNCPDNYDFVDNNCVNRSYPFEVTQPFCYA